MWHACVDSSTHINHSLWFLLVFSLPSPLTLVPVVCYTYVLYTPSKIKLPIINNHWQEMCVHAPWESKQPCQMYFRCGIFIVENPKTWRKSGRVFCGLYFCKELWHEVLQYKSCCDKSYNFIVNPFISSVVWTGRGKMEIRHGKLGLKLQYSKDSSCAYGRMYKLEIDIDDWHVHFFFSLQFYVKPPII